MRASVLFITYNHSLFVASAIRSAMAQDYPDLEIVVCDDCSSDSNLTILEEELGKCPPHITVIRAHSCQNVGLIENFNRGMAACTGEIIIPMSGDDRSLSNRVSTLMDEFKANPTCMLVCSNWTRIDASGNVLPGGCSRTTKSIYTYRGNSRSIYAKAPVCGAAAAYRSSLRDMFGPMIKGHHAEDNCYWFRALLVGNIHYLPTPLVEWRSHEENQSNWERDKDTAAARRRNIRFLRVHQNFSAQWKRDLAHARSQSLVTQQDGDKLDRIIRYDREWQRLRRYSITQVPWCIWIVSASRVIRANPALSVIKKTLLSQFHIRLSSRRRSRYWQRHFNEEN